MKGNVNKIYEFNEYCPVEYEPHPLTIYMKELNHRKEIEVEEADR